jgi:hypothetical protein
VVVLFHAGNSCPYQNLSLQFLAAFPALESAQLLISTMRPVRLRSPEGTIMKRQSYMLHTMILGIFVVLTVGMTHAQIGGDVLKVKIPFSFSVGMQTFPAGEYSLKPLLPNTMLLRNQAGQVLTDIGTNSVEASKAPTTMTLLFNGYGGQYFLSQIWKAGDSIGRELIKSPVELEMARKYSPGQQIALRQVAHR